ncbi:MAG: DegT/DnrJ/EryC1/StrS family aminotransferase [Acidimicrobiia bacterium]
MIDQADRGRVDAVLTSGNLAQGSEVEAFETEFAEALEKRPTVAVSSGTAGLITALMGLGVSTGDEVIVPSFTFAGTVNAVTLVGARPVFADIEPASYCLAPASVEQCITHRTAAVIAVHLYGHTAPMTEICEIATRSHLAVIEDACQALGATLDTHPVGTLGDAAVFSFYATKHITAGEGGAITCRSDDVARRCRTLRNQGFNDEGAAVGVGYNFRMTDIAASLARSQLERAEAMLRTRRSHARLLDTKLRGVTTPTVAPGVEHAYGNYTVRCERRDQALRGIRDRGVDARVYYPIPVHRMPAHSSELETGVDLPETDRASAEVLSLPVGPHLSADDINRVAAVVNEVTDP